MAYPDYTNNFDTKWKDQRTPCEYDVDDPTFCSPMSVINGLVSGFCERQAVVNSSFVTGTTASPVTSDWFAATSAGRDAIVYSCVQHVISHDLKPSDVGAESYKGPVDGSFHAVDHTSVLDGGTTKVTTYMTHMDGLIDSLVQTGEYKTDITGATAYTAFDQLASSASAAVAGTVSACGLASSGGTAYSSEFMPAFPKDWALERKWMLEQLRYTADNTSSLIKGNNTKYSGSSWEDNLTVDSATLSPDIAISGGTPFSNEIPASSLVLQIGMRGHNYDDATLSPSTACAVAYQGAATATVQTVGEPVTVVRDGYADFETFDYNIAWCTEADTASTNRTYEILDTAVLNGTSATSVDVIGTTAGVKLRLSAYLSPPNSRYDGVFYSSYMNEASVIVTGTTTFTAQNMPGMNQEEVPGTVIVVSGGTATVAAGVMDRVIVEPHGSLTIQNGARVTNCCILTAMEDGQVVSGSVTGLHEETTGADTVSSLLVDFVAMKTTSASSCYFVRNVQWTYAQDTVGAADCIVVRSGCTCIISASEYTGEVRVESGASVLIKDDGKLLGDCVVYKGGYIGLTGSGAYIGDESHALTCLFLHSGASCLISPPTDTEALTRRCEFLSGAMCTITCDAKLAVALGAPNNRGYLYVEDGAVIKVESAGNILNKPIDILAKYKWAVDCPDITYVQRFYDQKMVPAEGTLQRGWNIFEITPDGTSATLLTSRAAQAGVAPVKETMFVGVCNNNSYNQVYLDAGFHVCTIKAEVVGAGGVDHYTGFRLRQNAT